MKNKTTLAAFITAILLSSSAAYAAGDRTISLGYAQGDVRLRLLDQGLFSKNTSRTACGS